jgi:hypothetical protein
MAPTTAGYAEARRVMGGGSSQELKSLDDYGIKYLTSTFEELDQTTPQGLLVEFTLSEDLQAWRDSQLKDGHALPAKGDGLIRESDDVIRHLGIEDWPPCLLTASALYGCGLFNLLAGAYDAQTLYSNYGTDMLFYYEHGYHRVFPEFEMLLKQSFKDSRARQTISGVKRRDASVIVQEYVKTKMALEEKYQLKLGKKMMKMNRKQAVILSFCENSIWGGAADAIVRGYDGGAIMHDFGFSAWGTDIVDVGSDLLNSEINNTILCAADFTDTGLITAESLRRVHDAYAHCAARMCTERWAEPSANLNGMLYCWHICNERHWFMRRVLLGRAKARVHVGKREQREADFDEVFDEDFRTTGFSRPLRNPCDGGDPCDHVRARIDASAEQERALLADIWWLLSTGIVEYARAGVLSKERENNVAERLRVGLAKAISRGLIDELNWLTLHAHHHAWQVNGLYEMAMFGSLLDDGGLQGKLDRGGY